MRPSDANVRPASGHPPQPEPADRKVPPPPSARKLAANRANAARSTGPRTRDGKATSSLNAVSHGLTAEGMVLPGEEAADWVKLCADFDADLRPRGAAEESLVARICMLAWRLRRVGRAEAELYESQRRAMEKHFEGNHMIAAQLGLPPKMFGGDKPPEADSGPRFVSRQFEQSGTSALERLGVYEQRLDRQFHAALRHLEVLRKLRGTGWEDTSDGEKQDATRPADPVEPRPDVRQEDVSGSVTEDARDARTLSDARAERPRTPSAALHGRESAPDDRADGTIGHIPQNEPTAGPPALAGAEASGPDAPDLSD
jgi:hypothetical protein